MENAEPDFIHDAIRLELNASDLYMAYQEAFPEDAYFWWKLTLEKKRRAVFLKGWTGSDAGNGGMTGQAIRAGLADINDKVEVLLAGLRETSILREDAFDLAVLLEEVVGRQYSRQSIGGGGTPEIRSLFARMAGEAGIYASEIKEYARKNRIHETVGYGKGGCMNRRPFSPFEQEYSG